MVPEVKDSENQVGNQNEEKYEMELGIDPSMVLEILWGGLTHL